MNLPRRGLVVVLLLAGWAGLAGQAAGCPFCSLQGQTWLGDAKQSSMVLYGKVIKADENADTTTLEVEAILKDHPRRGKSKKVVLNKYIAQTKDSAGYRWLVFCDIYKGKIDPFRGVAFKKGSKVADYLRGAMKVQEKKTPEKLRFFFDYLDHSDLDICTDAFREFGNADYKDVKELAAKLFAEKHPKGKAPIERLVRWLEDKETPPVRIGLFASLLGYSGKAEYGKVFKKLLSDDDRKTGSGVDGLMAAFVMVNKKEGWPFLLGALKNTKEDFMFRYRALLAVRFLHAYRTDLVPKKDLVDAVCTLLEQEDISDMAIEDLRKWKAWDRAEKVLGLQKKEVYAQGLVKRAILRYCLQCPNNKKASAYVAARRKADAEGVADAEELLQLEEGTTKKKPADTSKK